MRELDKLNQLSESHGALQPGHGMVSGVIALALAVLCFLGVLAFHFPEYLTTPELRKSFTSLMKESRFPIAPACFPAFIRSIACCSCFTSELS